MATVIPTLTITSSDATSEALAISQTDSLTTTDPVVNTATESVTVGAAVVSVKAAKVTETYMYIKNTDGTNGLDLREATTNVVFGHLAAGEFAFFPVKASVGFEVIAIGGTVVVEYGFWSQ